MSTKPIIIDYNGQGKWSMVQIRIRYQNYCQQLKINDPQDINPEQIQNLASGKMWIYPVMNKIIDGIEQNDEACKIIGVELVEENTKMPFGRILKSNTARALRRTDLNQNLQARLRKRIISMLIDGNVPHEYKEYAKLLRKIRIDKNDWQIIEQCFPQDNQYTMKYYLYFKKYL